jgi:hypothetical protein
MCLYKLYNIAYIKKNMYNHENDGSKLVDR